MSFSLRSVRTKFILLVAAVALVVAGVSAICDLWSSGGQLREQVVLRGRYVASNLAFNAKYGVLTEDKPLLTQFLEGAVNAGGTGETSDVVGAMIRDAKGETLAQVGKAIRDLPNAPAAKLEERDATTADGDTVLLFRAPVTTSGSGGGLGEELSAAAPGGAEAVKGGVEVAISQRALRAVQRRRLIEALLLGLVLVGLGSAVGWALAGRWLRPLQEMAEASEQVAKGDLVVAIEAQGEDEVGTRGRSLNAM